MSEAENQAISVLLPNASMMVFSKDKDTLEAAQGVEKDWRFARVSITAQEGDAETAIAHFSSNASPDLLIIQTDEIGSGFTDQLEALSAHCNENTAAIIIGPDNDVNLYRKLIDMGVSDYLVRPLDAKLLGDVTARVLIERMGATGSTLVAMVGAKGGIGTSVLSEAMAHGVSEILGQKTLLLDACGGLSTLSVGMAFEPSTTLPEAVKAAENSDEDSVDRMIFKVTEKLGVLASGGEAMLDAPVNPEQYEPLLDMVLTKYPVVLVDLSGAAASLKSAVLRRANEIVLVSSATVACLRLARGLLQEVKDLRGGEGDGLQLLINMQGLAPANEVGVADIEAAMEMAPMSVIPFDPKLFVTCESEGRNILEDKAGEDIVRKSLLPALKNVVPGDAEGGAGSTSGESLLGGILGKLKS